MEEKKDNVLYCSHCGAIIDEDEDYETIDGEVVCTDCIRITAEFQVLLINAFKKMLPDDQTTFLIPSKSLSALIVSSDPVVL